MTQNLTARRFATKQDAIAAGYRAVVYGIDRDVSGFDHTYTDAHGNRTVPVFLTQDKNRMGQPGCVEPMFPPRTLPD